jgi:colanic acid biosynthesis glycosyl transferase WcaI
MKRLWIVSELYYPEESATGYYVTHIAEGLAASFPVSVLCSQPTYASRGVKAPWREHRNGVNVRRCWSTTFSKDKLLSRFANVITICVSLFVAALRASRAGDVFLVTTNPPLLPAFISLAAKLRRARCVMLTHDVYPDVLASIGVLRKESFAYRAVSSVGSKIFRSMDMVFVLGRDMEVLVRGHLGASAVPVQVITNWADTESIVPLPRMTNPLLRDLGLADKFVILYSGNMGRTHSVETIVEAARRLRRHSDIFFLLIGWGAKEGWLKNTVVQEQLDNILVMLPRPRHEIPISLNACDLAIISFVSSMAGISVPSRMYNIMSAGKPLLAATDESSELAMLINEEGAGITVSPEDPQGLAEAILALRADRRVLNEMGRLARRAAECKYAKPLILAKYSAALACYLDPDRVVADEKTVSDVEHRGTANRVRDICDVEPIKFN